MDIKKIITKHGMTPKIVAEKMGIKRRELSYIMEGIPSYTNVHTLRKIADIIGCKIGDFFLDELTISDLPSKCKKSTIGYYRIGDDNGFCYIMKDDNYPKFYKIGKSKSPRAREHTLLHDAPTITLFKVVETNQMSLLESKIHKILENNRRRGEWFELTDNELKIIIESFGFVDYTNY
jgi:transcriptional regulator with XRE-family HTH domain